MSFTEPANGLTYHTSITSSPPEVLQIGDSLTATAVSLFTQAYSARGMTAAVWGASGSKAAQWVQKLQNLDEQYNRPQKFVIELGTNDAGPTSAADYFNAMDQLAAITAGRPTYLVNLNSCTGVPLKDLAMEAMNWEMVKVYSKWPHVRLINTRDAVCPNMPSYTYDGVHFWPGGPGMQLYVNTIVNGVNP